MFPKVSILIVTGYQNPKYVQEVIDTVWELNYTCYPPCTENCRDSSNNVAEIIVVETADRPKDFSFFYQKKIKFHRITRPFFEGVIHEAWNYGLENFTGDYIFICNDDIVFGTDSIINTVSTMQKNGLWAAYPAHTSHQFSENFFDLAEAKAALPDGVQGPPEFRGFCFAISREGVEKIGKFRDFNFWYGDTDYWYRSIVLGHPAREVANALIHHYEGAGTLGRTDPGYAEAFSEAIKRDAERFQQLWGTHDGQIISGQELLKRYENGTLSPEHVALGYVANPT